MNGDSSAIYDGVYAFAASPLPETSQWNNTYGSEITQGTPYSFDNIYGETSVMQIFDYAQTDKGKTVLFSAGSQNRMAGMSASFYRSTTGLTTLLIRGLSGGTPIFAGSSFSLYGVSA